jgi:predicted permease
MPNVWSRLRSAVRLVAGFRHLRGEERDMREEMQFHVDMQAEELVRHGMSPSDARRSALVAFGGRAQHADNARDEWRSRLLDETIRDARFAVRSLRRSPVFTTAVLVSLAVGIGATSTIYTVTERVVLRPVPYDGRGELAMLWTNYDEKPAEQGVNSYPDILDWIESSRDVESSATFNIWAPTLTSNNDAEPLVGSRVTADFFHVLGAAPMLGRTFRRDEDVPGGPPVAVIGYPLWIRRFGGDSSIVGRTITLGATPYTIVGVMPAGFRDPEPHAGTQRAEIWTTLDLAPSSQQRQMRYLRAVARFRPGVTIEQAQRDLRVVGKRLAQTYPESNRKRGVLVVPMQEQVVGQSRGVLFAALGGALCLLLIVCGNVASLVLARHSVRAGELAVRAAMGAPRERVVRMLLLESVLLATAGGALGLAVTVAATGLVRHAAPPDLPRIDEIAVDGAIVAATTAIAMTTAVLFGLFPALRASRQNISTTLHTTGRRATTSARTRGAIVVMQLALSVVLLSSAGLLAKSLMHLDAVPLGVMTDRVLTFRVSIPGPKYATENAQRAFFSALLAKARERPGVTDVAAASYLPLTTLNNLEIAIAGDERHPVTGEGLGVYERSVTPGYFSVLGIPMVAGRTFGPSDTAGAPNVVVINQAAAKRFFPDDNPLGRRLLASVTDTIRFTVVGIVSDVRFDGPAAPAQPEMFHPLAQNVWSTNAIVVRTRATPIASIPAMRSVVRSLDPGVPLTQIATMSDLAARFTARQRFYGIVFGSFAVAALVLSAIGMYGIVAYVATQRRREIAIRMTLGAEAARVLREFVVRALALAAIGLACGVAGAIVVARVLETLLYDVSPNDATTLLGAGLTLVATAVVASVIPAAIATRIPLASALREE